MAKPIEQRAAAVARLLLSTVSNTKDELPFHINACIQAEMNAGDKAWDKLNATWSNSQKLQHRGGAQPLSLSFGGGESSSTKITTADFKVKAEIGSKLPYASIHEEGGFIRSKRTKTTRNGRVIPMMAAYFWAMYYAGKQSNPFYRTMALSVTRKGGVNIPARPYFKEAMKGLEKHYNEVVYPSIEQQINKAWNDD